MGRSALPVHHGLRHWGLVALLLVPIGGCDSQPPPSDPPHVVDYTLTWQTENVTRGADTLEVVTDLGYTVVVERAYLVTFSVQLVPCEDETEITLTRVMGWLLGGIAHAGHGGENRDPSAALLPRVETLLEPVTVHHARRPLTDERYCRIHYLVGPAGPDSVASPADFQLEGTSLYLEGRWYEDDPGAAVPFEVTSRKAYGALTHLYPEGRFEDEDARLVWAAGEMGGEVIVERHLGTLFHKINWPTISAVDLEAQLLRNLIGDTRIRVILDARN